MEGLLLGSSLGIVVGADDSLGDADLSLVGDCDGSQDG